MKTLFIVFTLLCGASVSYIKYRDVREIRRAAEHLFGLCSFAEEQIRYARAPLERIVSTYSEKHGLNLTLEYLTGNSDPAVREMSQDICTLDFDGALSRAVLLKNYAEKEMKRTEDETSKGVALGVALPLALSLLAVILFI